MNKKGKKVGKPVFAGYMITFSTAMNQGTLANSGNYVIDTVVPVKKTKKKPPRSSSLRSVSRDRRVEQYRYPEARGHCVQNEGRPDFHFWRRGKRTRGVPWVRRDSYHRQGRQEDHARLVIGVDGGAEADALVMAQPAQGGAGPDCGQVGQGRVQVAAKGVAVADGVAAVLLTP